MEGRPPFDDEGFPDVEDPIDSVSAAGAGAGPGRGGLIPDAVKKALLAGVGALFMTEEGARRLARDWKLPKELIGYVGQQAQGAKDEILRMLAEEVRHFLESEAVRREFWKALSATAVEVKAEIRFVSTEAGVVRPEVKASVRPRRAGGKGQGKRKGKGEA